MQVELYETANLMVVSIFTISKYLTHYGGFLGGKKGQKVSKTAYLPRNEYQMLQLSTFNLFQMVNFFD